MRSLSTPLFGSYGRLSALREYTVEAGRPDTISTEKLEALKKHGVTRVSVNPQTMDDKVLEAIGRKHSAQDVLDALDLVSAVGGFQVNMDLIAGLPLDNPERFSDTLNTILRLNPENITVHTLTLKRASRIIMEGQEGDYADVAAMLSDLARECRIGDVRMLAGVYADRDPSTGLTLLFKPETVPPGAEILAH